MLTCCRRFGCICYLVVDGLGATFVCSRRFGCICYLVVDGLGATFAYSRRFGCICYLVLGDLGAIFACSRRFWCICYLVLDGLNAIFAYSRRFGWYLILTFLESSAAIMNWTEQTINLGNNYYFVDSAAPDLKAGDESSKQVWSKRMSNFTCETGIWF